MLTRIGAKYESNCYLRAHQRDIQFCQRFNKKNHMNKNFEQRSKFAKSAFITWHLQLKNRGKVLAISGSNKF